MKKAVIILLMTMLLVACDSNNEDLQEELSKKDKQILEYKNQIDYLTETITEKELLNVEQDELNNQLRNELETKNNQYEDKKQEYDEKKEELESKLLDLRSQLTELRLEIDVRDEAEYSDIVGNEEVELGLLFEMFAKYREGLDFIEDELISKEEARALFFEAQEYYEFTFIWPTRMTFTPKDLYNEYYSESDKIVDEGHWFLMNKDGKPLSESDFHDEVLTYFTPDILEEKKRNIVNLEKEDISADSRATYGVYKNQIYSSLRWKEW